MNGTFVALLVGCLTGLASIHGAALYESAAMVESNEVLVLVDEPLPVTPGTKYLLAFKAKADGEHTLEFNERIRITDHQVANRFRLQFFDGEARPVPGGQLDVMVLSQQWYQYARAFYPPAEARSVSLSLVSVGGENLAVKEISLSSDLSGDEAQCLNPHPSFAYGDLNQYGYRSGYGGRFYERPDGKTVWKSGFCGYSPRFAVKAGTYYTITCIGKPYRERKVALFLECYGETGTKPFKAMRVGFSEEGTTTELLIPEGTVSVNLLCYFVIFEKICITERSTPGPVEE